MSDDFRQMNLSKKKVLIIFSNKRRLESKVSVVPMFIGALAMAIVPDRIRVALNIDFLEKAALPASD